MARWMLRVRPGKTTTMLVLVTLAGGCFVPPGLEREGGSKGPSIDVELTEPEVRRPFTAYQTPKGALKPEQRAFNVWMSDPDSPTLHARLFLDRAYDLPVAEVEVAGGCNVADKPCTANFLLTGPCDDMVNNLPGRHDVEVYVSDQPWPDNDPNDYRKLAPGAFGTNDSWPMICDVVTQTSDGGS